MFEKIYETHLELRCCASSDLWYTVTLLYNDTHSAPPVMVNCCSHGHCFCDGVDGVRTAVLLYNDNRYIAVDTNLWNRNRTRTLAFTAVKLEHFPPKPSYTSRQMG